VSEPQYLSPLQLTLPLQQSLQFPLHAVSGAVHGAGVEGEGGVGCKETIMKKKIC
jgi:hypothetical protein